MTPGTAGPGRPDRRLQGQLGELAAEVERDARRRMPVVQSTLRNFDPGPRRPGPGEPEQGYSYSRTYRGRDVDRRRRLAAVLYLSGLVLMLALVPACMLGLGTPAFLTFFGVALLLAAAGLIVHRNAGGRRG